MNDKLQKLYDLYVQSGLIKTTDFKTFSSSNEQQIKKLYDLGKQSGLIQTTDYNTFNGTFNVNAPVKKKSTTGSQSVQKKKPTSSVTMPSWMQESLVPSPKKEQPVKQNAEQKRQGVYVSKEDVKAPEIKGTGGQYGFTVTPTSKEQKAVKASVGSKVYSGFPGQEENKYRVKNNRWERLYGTNWTEVTNDGSVSALNNYFEKNLNTLKGEVKDDKQDLKRMRSVLRVEEEIASGKEYDEKQFEDRVEYYNIVETQKYLRSKGYDIDVNGIKDDPKTLKALSSSNAKKKIDQGKDFEIEDMRDAVDSIITNKFLMRTEEDAVSVLRKQFGKHGFIFEESGMGTDYVKVTTPGGLEKEFGFDYSNPEVARSEAANMSNFIKKAYMTKSEKKEFEGDGTKMNQEQEDEYFFDLVNLMGKNPNKYSTNLFSYEEMNNGISRIYSNLKDESKSLEYEYEDIQKRIEEYNANPDDIKEKIAIDKDLYALKKKGLDIKEKYDKLNGTEKNLQKITGLEFAKKEKKGNFLGIITGQLAQGFTNVEKSLLNLSADILPYAIGEDVVDSQTRLRLQNEGYTDNQILDYASKQLKRTVVKDITEGITRVATGGSTTKEYISSEDRNDFEKTVSFLSESIGTSLSGGGNPMLQKIAFFTQSYNGMEEQMSSPEFDGLTEFEKKLISVPYGFVIGALERYGFAALGAGKNPVVDRFARGIIGMTMKSLPKDASINTVKREINKSVSRMIGQGALRVVGGAVVEGATEGTQQLAEIAEKNIVNDITDKDYFKDVPDLSTAKGIGEALNIAKEDAYYGFLGGLLYSTVSNSLDVRRDHKFNKKTDEEFQLFYEAMTDTKVVQSNKLQVKLDLKDGKITKEEAKDRIGSINDMNAKLKSINSNLSFRDKKDAFNLILEREKLTKEKAPLDEALQAPYNDRITEINNELKVISENAIKASTEQEVTAEGDGVQREGVVEGQPEVGQGEGTVGQATEQGADLGDSTVKVRSQEEIDTRVSELESMLANDATSFQETGIGSLLPEAKSNIQNELEALKSEAKAKPLAKPTSKAPSSEDVSLTINNISTAIEDGKSYGYLDSEGKVEDRAITVDDVDLESERVKRKAEKGTLTAEDLMSTFFGKTAAANEVAAIVDAFNSNPSAVDEVVQRVKERISGTKSTTVTVEAAPAPKIAETTDTKTYSEALSSAKAELKAEGNGLDLQVSDVSQEEADQIVAEGGKIFMTEDGLAGAYVKKDGYMGGLFKSPKATYKEVAKLLQQARIKVGGKFMDAYATELERIYVKNGFRPIARMKFNEEYAPEGWDAPGSALAGKPDVVFFAYDPEGKYKIGDGEYVEDYDAAYEMAKNFDSKVSNEADKLAELMKGSTVVEGTNEQVDALIKEISDSDIVVAERTILEQVANATKALKSILPNVKFVLHSTDKSFREAVGETNEEESSRGAYDPDNKVIHINLTSANNRTVMHEVFHAIIVSKVSSDAKLQSLTKNMVKSVIKSLKQSGANQNVITYLEEFSAGYKVEEQNEEKLSELFALLGETYKSLPYPTQNIIQRFLDRVAKMFGLKEMTDREVVDFMNSLSGRVEAGIEINPKQFNGGKKVSKPSEGLTTRKQYGNNKVKVEVRYLEQERMDELIKNGLVQEVDNLSALNGQKAVTTSPDDMLVGSIYVNGKEVATGNGGIFFVTKFGDVWANSNKGVTQGLASAINESSKANGGKAYLILVKGSDAKLVSSPQGVTSSLAVTESMLDAGLFSLSDFRNAIRSAVKKAGGDISLSQNGSAKTLKNELDALFSDVTASTFEKRGNVLRDIIANLAKSESASKNKAEIVKFLNGDTSKGLGVGVTPKSQSLVDLVAKVSAEELTKGLNVGDIYGVIEINGEVDVFQDKHQSYPYHIKMVDKDGNVSSEKPVLILPKNRKNGRDILTSLDGQTSEELGTGFSGKVGATSNLPYGKGIIQDDSKTDTISKAQIEEEVKTLEEEMKPKMKKQHKQKDVKENWTPTPVQSMGNSVISKRNEQVEEAAKKLTRGEITQREYVDVRKKYSPINRIGQLFAPASTVHMEEALGKKSDKLMAPVLDENGNKIKIVGTRLDIPSYLNKNAWVVTIHDGKNENGKVISYRNSVRLKNVAFSTDPRLALNVAAGYMPKSTFGRIMGEMVEIPGNTAEDQGINAQVMIEEIMNNPAWIQVGMNPFRQSWFWNRETGAPVVSADEVIQIGGLVYAKNAKEVSPDSDEFTVFAKYDEAKDKLLASDEALLDSEGNRIRFQRGNKKAKNQAAVIVKKGKEANLSDAGIREYMKRNGYTDRQAFDAIQAYNDKKEGIFIDPNWSKLRKAAVLFNRKYFVSRGLLANTVFASNEKRLAIVAKQLNKAQSLITDFDRALDVIRKESIAQYKRDVREYINGDPTVSLPAEIKAQIDSKTGIKDRIKLMLAIRKLADKNVEKKRADFDAYIRDKQAVLPTELKKVADSMRAHIDSISRELISNGLIEENLAERVIDNLGSYLNRSYKIYDRKNWKKEIEKEVKDKAINFLKIQLRPIAEEQAKKENRDVDDVLDDLAKIKIERYFSEQEEDMNLFSSGGKLGSKNLSVLKAREEIPVEIRMLMGEYTDPGQNYAKTILKMSGLAANHQFLNEVKKAGTGVFLFEKNDSLIPEGYNYKIAAEGSVTMNPLNGMYTSKELKEEFEKQSSQLSKFWSFYMNILSRVKWGKTIMSPTTHIKNLIGNIGFVLVNGHWRIGEMATAYKAVRDDLLSLDKKNSREYVNKLIQLGIIKQSAGMGEIRAMFADASWEESMLSNINKKSGSRWGKVKSGWNRFTKGAEDAYQAEDDFYKIFAYENELSRYSKAMFGKKKKDLTESEKAEVDLVVAEIVKNTYPTYSRIPEAVNMIRRAPLVGNFVSFQAESYRTAYMTAQLALKEIKSDNPRIRLIGAQRLAGGVIYKSIKTAILAHYSYAAGMGGVGLLGYFFDDDDEKQKEDDLRKFLPEWSTNADLIVKQASDGKIVYIDMSASDPHGGINKVINSIVLGETTLDAFINGVGSIVEPFVGEEMTTAALLSLKNNENAYGKPIYNPEDNFYEKSKDITGFMFNVVQPGIVASGRRIGKAENVLEEIGGAVTGARTYNIDVAESFGYTMMRYEERLINANRIYTSEVHDKEATEKSIAAAKKRAEKAVTEIHAEIYDLYYSAVRLGADEDKLYMNLKSFGGMTKRTINYMFGQEDYYIKNKYPEEEEE